jgi:hypothetical protein
MDDKNSKEYFYAFVFIKNLFKYFYCHCWNKPLQAAMSEFIRCTRTPLKVFVELVRCQTAEEYRPSCPLLC